MSGGQKPMMMVLAAVALAILSSSSSAVAWVVRNINEGNANPPPIDPPPEASVDTQEPSTKVYVTAGPNVPQDWTRGKIVYGKCEGAECSSNPAGSMKLSIVCKGKKVVDKKSFWNPMTNSLSKPVCTKKDGCSTGQAGVVTAADLAKATGPMCPIGSKPVAGNDKLCINPQTMRMSGLSKLEDIKAYSSAMKGGVKAMTAYYAKKNASDKC
jgi:hypothetical protein